MNIDKLLKMGLLTLGIIFLFLYYLNTQNNRYTLIGKANGELLIMDTSKGSVYVVGVNSYKWVVINPIDGSRTDIKDLRMKR